MKTKLEKLEQKLQRIDNKLEKVRGCSPLTDGWQTKRYAQKSRTWDILAQYKFQIIKEIEEEKIRLGVEL